MEGFTREGCIQCDSYSKEASIWFLVYKVRTGLIPVHRVYLHIHPVCSVVLNMGQTKKNNPCMHNYIARITVPEWGGWTSKRFLSCVHIVTQRFHLPNVRVSNNPGWACARGGTWCWPKEDQTKPTRFTHSGERGLTTASWCVCEVDTFAPEGRAAILIISGWSSCTLWQQRAYSAVSVMKSEQNLRSHHRGLDVLYFDYSDHLLLFVYLVWFFIPFNPFTYFAAAFYTFTVFINCLWFVYSCRLLWRTLVIFLFFVKYLYT